MTCAICMQDGIFEYKVCDPCREVLIRIETENRSKFIEEMLASPAAQRPRIRARWRGENRRAFYPENLPG